jgi:hypothetical protein
MTTQPNDGLLYLQDYPRLRKWINQCVGYQRLGHKPELPAQVGVGVAAQNLRRYFPEMAVDSAGLCEQCAAALLRGRASNLLLWGSPNEEGSMTEAEWLAHGLPILAMEADRGWPNPRKQRLFAVACCRRLLRLLPNNLYLEEALVVAERYTDRQVTKTDLKDVKTSIRYLRFGRSSGERTYADTLAEMAATAVGWACELARRTYAGQAARNAASAAAYAALPPEEPHVPPGYSAYAELWGNAEKAEIAVQISLLRDICGDPFHPITPSIAPLKRDIIQLARACYGERLLPTGELNPRRLAELADALQEAGCADKATLAHCRLSGPHVCGCWAIDLLLGKK